VEAASPGPPNVLLIVADDLGFSDIGSFGGEIRTPTLDALAAEGVRFTNFHVLPTCSPSRSVLLSGVDNHQAGLGTMDEVRTPEMEGLPGYLGHLNFQVAALPEVLSGAGYRTYMSGKWHLGATEETAPHARGFEHSFALLQGGGSHYADRRRLSPPQPMVYERDGEVVALPEDFYSTRFYTDTLISFLEEDRTDERPFFAYLSYTAPHDPLHAPREYIEQYAGNYDEGWDTLRAKRIRRLSELGIVPEGAAAFPRLPTVPAWEAMSGEERALAARDMEVYAAMVDYMDEEIGRLFAYLREIGEYDNTLIVFMSDNGANGARAETAYPGQTAEHMESFDNSLDNRGMPGSFVDTGPGWAQASSGPCRMFKGFPSEGGIRAPLVLKLPGNMTGAGRQDATFLHVRDIMPTILDAAGAPHPDRIGDRDVIDMQGRSMSALIEGGAAPEGTGSVGYELFGFKAYIAGGWKILMMVPPFGTGEWQLYNLSVDPGETNDLAGEHPEKLSELVELWEAYREANGVLDVSLDLSMMAE